MRSASFDVTALASLRHASSTCHRELEESVFARALGRGLLRPDQYACLLAAMRPFHALVEQQIAASDDPRVATVRGVVEPRAPRLSADLDALARERGPLDLDAAARAWESVAGAMPALDGAFLLGALYTLEGSALGGQVILPRLRASLGVSDEALGYYIGHGADTRRRFGELAARLEQALAEPAAIEEAGRGARWAFATVHALFDELAARTAPVAGRARAVVASQE